ncbi:hypothetical protein [Actinokineospora sp. HUAS TT18]|uniref:hypothetical protein n=1 Tax=Actinokineospora sp. HUAS TT18 TaxID=3447451 RepID=UPI003F51D5D2
MTANDTHAPRPELTRSLPSGSVVLAPAPPDTVPMHPPAGAWGLVVIAVRTTHAAGHPLRRVGDPPAADPAHTDTADLMAGVWQPDPPPADLHAGDVVVRLHPSADDDPATTDIEVLAAIEGQWRQVGMWRSAGARWPHEIATTVLLHMRTLADAVLTAAQWATFGGPLTAALNAGLMSGLITEATRPPRRRAAPDALPALIAADHLAVGDPVVFGLHVATAGSGGALHHDGPLGVSTVSALATSLAGYTANGWYLWRRAHDHRLLADLRAELATR